MIQPIPNRHVAACPEESGKPSTYGARMAWNRPMLRKLQSSDALTGANSTADANATFS